MKVVQCGTQKNWNFSSSLQQFVDNHELRFYWILKYLYSQ